MSEADPISEFRALFERAKSSEAGDATAYGLTSYTSPHDGRSYVFVTQADGNQVVQIEVTSVLQTSAGRMIFGRFGGISGAS